MAETSKLSEATKSMRKYIIGFLIFAIIVIIAQNLYGYIKNRGNNINDANSPYQYIDEGFGEITYPNITSLAIADGSNPSYTVSGQLKGSPTSVNVYKVNKPKETLSSVTQGIEIANKLGIEGDYQTEQSTLIWQTSRKQTLKFDKISQSVDYTNQGIDLNILRANKPDFTDIKIIEKDIDSAVNGLSNLKAQSTNYSETSKLSYFLADGNIYKTTSNTENADYIRKDYYPQHEIVSLKTSTTEAGVAVTSPIDLTSSFVKSSTDITGGGAVDPAVSSLAQAISGRTFFDNPNEGYVNIVLANSTQVTAENTQTGENDRVREFHQLGLQISSLETDKATYSLKPITEAWEDVKDGKASLKYLVKQGADPLADYSPLKVKRFILDPDKSELGYFTTKTWTGYIYPIYVLRGTAELHDGKTADFVFYVKAISSADNK